MLLRPSSVDEEAPAVQSRGFLASRGWPSPLPPAPLKPGEVLWLSVATGLGNGPSSAVSARLAAFQGAAGVIGGRFGQAGVQPSRPLSPLVDSHVSAGQRVDCRYKARYGELKRLAVDGGTVEVYEDGPARLGDLGPLLDSVL